MSEPTPYDPLGQRPDPLDFGEAITKVVDARIAHRMRGHSSRQFDGIPDTLLVHELLARGWAVFRPMTNQ